MMPLNQVSVQRLLPLHQEKKEIYIVYIVYVNRPFAHDS